MKLEEFLTVAREAGKYYVTERAGVPMLTARWTTGGTWVDCWGDGGTVGAESEPELDGIDEILTAINPAISYLQYKRVAARIDHGTDGDSDYYGGYTHYGTKTLLLTDMYEALVEARVIQAD